MMSRTIRVKMDAANEARGNEAHNPTSVISGLVRFRLLDGSF
jgi:hypothetical protein